MSILLDIAMMTFYGPGAFSAFRIYDGVWVFLRAFCGCKCALDEQWLEMISAVPCPCGLFLAGERPAQEERVDMSIILTSVIRWQMIREYFCSNTSVFHQSGGCIHPTDWNADR